MTAALSTAAPRAWPSRTLAPEPRRSDETLRDALARPQGWDTLVRDAARPTPFYAPACLAAHEAAGFCRGVRVAAARRAESLAALLPYRPGGAWLGWARVNVAWSSPYTTSSDPLVDASDLDGGVGALLSALAGVPGRTWLLPRLSLDGPVGAALRDEIERRGWPAAVLDPFPRAVLEARPSEAAFEAGLDGRRRKDLRRRRRRLEEAGSVSFVAASRGPALQAGIESFLTLELGGWKGRRGTALASRPATATLARSLFGEGDGAVVPRADVMVLDGRPVAASLSLVCRGTAFLLKSAYDESLARFAPGMLLEDHIARALHRERFANRLDSAAGPDSHLDALFPDRELVGDLAFATSPTAVGRKLFAARIGWEEKRRAVLRRAKDVHRRARGGA